MCNLYSMTTTHEAMRKLFRVQSGINQLRLPGIFPDYQAPIVRQRADGEREIVMARWGMPTPPAFVKGSINQGEYLSHRRLLSAVMSQELPRSGMLRWS